MSKKFLSMFLCIAMSFSALAGCSSGETEAPKEAITGNEETKEKVPSPNETEKPGEPTKLTWRISTDPPTLDPQINNKSVGNTVIGRIFEGLIYETYDLQYVPAVAEKWDVSDDGKTLTFYLREDAKWSDGVPVTSKDFEYAWKRGLNPETGSSAVANFFYILNAEQYYEGEVDFSEVGMKFPDEHTVVLELATAMSLDEALYYISSNIYIPLREDIISANPDNWTTSPDKIVTNGPFKMAGYKMNEEITLVKDDNYWDKENKGLLDEIRFVFIDDSLTALRAFEAGEIDGFDGIPTEEIPRMALESDEFHLVPKISYSFFALNVTKPPLDNKLVREALVLAIDKEMIASSNVAGTSKPASGIVPFGAVSNGKDFRTEADKEGIRSPINGDIERAKAALAEAGYPDGQGFPKIEYLYNASGGNTQTAEMLQEMWKKNLNINVDLVNVEYKVESERRHSGEFQLARSTWNGSRFPFSFLQMFRTGDYNNTPQYSNAEYDELIDAIRLEVDLAKKDELLNQAEKWIIDEYVICPIVYGTSSYVMNQRIKGVQITPTGSVVFEFMYAEN